MCNRRATRAATGSSDFVVYGADAEGGEPRLHLRLASETVLRRLEREDVEHVELVVGGGRSSLAPSRISIRQVPQLALLHENGIGAAWSSHVSTSAPPSGTGTRSGVAALPLARSKMTVGIGPRQCARVATSASAHPRLRRDGEGARARRAGDRGRRGGSGRGSAARSCDARAAGTKPCGRASAATISSARRASPVRRRVGHQQDDGGAAGRGRARSRRGSGRARRDHALSRFVGGERRRSCGARRSRRPRAGADRGRASGGEARGGRA